MKELFIHKSETKAIVDDEDYERLLKYRWTYYNKTITRQENIGVLHRHVSIHAEVMRDKRNMFDHIDRDIFNNQKSNLRMCSISQNNANREKCKKKCSSQYKGVSKRKLKWEASITIDNRYRYIGRYKTEIEAASAYNKKALETWGEFALLNKDENGNIL